jgi:Calcineurin-like phosphoesterase
VSTGRQSSFRILHISDPHFGDKSYYGDVAQYPQLMAEVGESLAKAGLIDRNGPKPFFDAAILSGDFTWQGRSNGFQTSAKFISLLTMSRYCKPDSILLIPGNHDMSYMRDGVAQWTAPVVEQPYRDFIADVLGETPEPVLFHIKEFRDRGIVLAGLNSTRIIRDDTNELGYVGYDQLFAVMNRIWKARPAAGARPELLVMVLHHHLTHMDTAPAEQLVPPRAQRRYSYDVDAPAILEAMGAFNVEVILHGHQHLRWLERHQAGDPVGKPPQPFWISAAASAGICHPDSRDEHHFQVLEISEDLRTLQLHHFSARVLAKEKPREWGYRCHDPLALEPRPLLRPAANEWARMDGKSRAWNSFYQREEVSWDARQLIGGGDAGWSELYRRVLAYWEAVKNDPKLPEHLRAKAAFERALRATLEALRREHKSFQERFEKQLDTPNALSLVQYVLHEMLRLTGPAV